MNSVLCLLTWLIIVSIIFIIAYSLSYRNKLNKLNPPAQRCYHINKLPSITSLLPKLILFSLIKSQGTPLQYCKLISPHKPPKTKNDKKQKKISSNRPIQTINISDPENKSNTVDDDDKEIYEYFSEIEVMIDSISIDPLHLVSYNKLFKTKNYEQISICYLGAMRFALTPYMITKDEFPMSPLGLINIGTEITMYQRLSVTDTYEITTSLHELRDMNKGIEIDIVTSVYLLKKGSNESKMVYESVETLLSRNKNKMKEYKVKMKDEKYKNKLKDKQNKWKKEFDVNDKRFKQNEIIKTDIDVLDDVSIKYAKVTGDYNPHHLQWTAKFIGYKNPIVHGMWSLQRCLTQIKHIYYEKKNMFIYKYPIKVVSTFKLPIYMPSKVKLITNYYPKSNDYLTFALVSKDEKLPHVLGSIIIE